MCDARHRPANGADSEPPPATEREMLDAAVRFRDECHRGRLGAAVLTLRDFGSEDREHIAAILDSDRPPEPSRAGPQSERGQAMVEAALMLPLLLLVIAGGLLLGLAMFDRSTLTHAAQEAARSAAVAGAEDSACDSAIAAVAALSGRSHAACDGSDGLAMDYAPADDPPTVTIRLDGGSYPVPFLQVVTVAGEAGAIIRPPEPSPSPSEAP